MANNGLYISNIQKVDGPDDVEVTCSGYGDGCGKPATCSWSAFNDATEPLWIRCEDHPILSAHVRDRSHKLPLPKKQILRASIVFNGIESAKLKADSPEKLRKMIVACGLVIDIDAAICIGQQIEIAWSKKRLWER